MDFDTADFKIIEESNVQQAHSCNISNNSKQKKYKFIDLFAGMGGTRIGFEQACIEKKIKTECVFTSEIKPHAIEAYTRNFNDKNIHGDITKINPRNIPDFDFLLAGFPCQPFSSAGKRNGFLDERGGLFFTIIDILKTKQPLGFLLENVDGLVNHDNGNTISTMISMLEEIGYKTSYKTLDASEFGIPQKRKRVYIIGRKDKIPFFGNYSIKKAQCGDFIDYDFKFTPSSFSKLLNKHFEHFELFGKAIKDKRGGANNIHSWDLELKGAVSEEQKELLNLILKKRRNKQWAENKGIDWMDGMPLTKSEILSFYDHPDIDNMLSDLTRKGYLKLEHPKEKILVDGVFKRIPKKNSQKGYNIVAGKLSYPIAKILDPKEHVPTIVATEAGKIAVSTPNGVRPITKNEGLKFSGFPKNYDLNDIDYVKSFDLLGNTVMPPVIKYVTTGLII